jgi:hypothetical protein
VCVLVDQQKTGGLTPVERLVGLLTRLIVRSQEHEVVVERDPVVDRIVLLDDDTLPPDVDRKT